jgi:hypothetical protein
MIMTSKQAKKKIYKLVSHIVDQTCKGQSQFWRDAYWGQYEYLRFVKSRSEVNG